MELYQEYHRKAMNFFRMADHLIYVTMPVVADVKLIMTALDDIHMALINGMNTVLEYERMHKRIMPLAENFDFRLDVFSKVAGRYGFVNEELFLIREIKGLVDDRKNASMEFTRPGKFVICNEDYRMKTISINEIKKYLSTTKNFLTKVDNALK